MSIASQFNYEMLQESYKTRMELNRLNEAEQVEISDKLITKLYQTMLEKYKFVDFGDIPETKGDITKLPQFQTLRDSIDLLGELKQKAGIVHLAQLDTINTALHNIEHYKNKFMLGFSQDISLIQVLYNTISASIIAGVNILIYTMVDFVKTPGGDFNAALEIQKRSHSSDFLLLENLDKFNANVQKGEINKFFDTMLNAEKFIGASVATSAVVVGTLVAITPVIRELIYYMYHMRMSVSEYLDAQAQFLELNANSLRYNDNKSTQGKKKTVVSNQERIAKKIRDWSHKFRIKSDTSEKQARKDVSQKIDFNELKTSSNAMDTGSNGFSLA